MMCGNDFHDDYEHDDHGHDHDATQFHRIKHNYMEHGLFSAENHSFFCYICTKSRLAVHIKSTDFNVEALKLVLKKNVSSEPCRD